VTVASWLGQGGWGEVLEVKSIPFTLFVTSTGNEAVPATESTTAILTEIATVNLPNNVSKCTTDTAVIALVAEIGRDTYRENNRSSYKTWQIQSFSNYNLSQKDQPNLRTFVFHLVVRHLLSAATLVAADYGFTCPPRFMSVCVLVVCVGTDKNLNFSAVRSPIELKLGGDLGLVSQISEHVLVSRFDYFLYCKQTKDREKRENCGFTELAFSPPFQVRLI
jgi:hypothetical protein